MSADESPRVTLDPGLTALALRALHEPDGHYPFVGELARHGRPGGRSTRAGDTGWLRSFVAFLGAGGRPLMGGRIQGVGRTGG